MMREETFELYGRFDPAELAELKFAGDSVMPLEDGWEIRGFIDVTNALQFRDVIGCVNATPWRGGSTAEWLCVKMDYVANVERGSDRKFTAELTFVYKYGGWDMRILQPCRCREYEKEIARLHEQLASRPERFKERREYPLR